MSLSKKNLIFNARKRSFCHPTLYSEKQQKFTIFVTETRRHFKNMEYLFRVLIVVPKYYIRLLSHKNRKNKTKITPIKQIEVLTLLVEPYFIFLKKINSKDFQGVLPYNG